MVSVLPNPPQDRCELGKCWNMRSRSEKSMDKVTGCALPFLVQVCKSGNLGQVFFPTLQFHVDLCNNPCKHVLLGSTPNPTEILVAKKMNEMVCSYFHRYIYLIIPEDGHIPANSYRVYQVTVMEFKSSLAI
ncbi:uncharacterized protein LOC104452658 [Eucalyptus grandis]|uniref:uncharacterized protein LOC104452658 n=1 Tax=Eucalyptus grandis TaxID=71139 RepID=UPI00192EC0F8|nr:uncharacterized protein LOC104452658 [Eucalyptus grandis]